MKSTVAQLVERLAVNQKVDGSIPFRGDFFLKILF